MGRHLFGESRVGPQPSARYIADLDTRGFGDSGLFAIAVEVETPGPWRGLGDKGANQAVRVILGACSRPSGHPAGVDTDDVVVLMVRHAGLFLHRVRNHGEHEIALAGELAVDRRLG